MAYGSLKQRLSRFLLLFMSLLWISGIVYAYQISPSALQANDLDEEETAQSVLQKYQTELSDVHQSYKRTIASYYEVVQNEYIPQLDSTYNAHYSYMQSMYNNYDGVTQTFSAYSSDMYNECVLGKQELLNIYNDAQSRQATISANESALQSVQRYQTELSDVYTNYKQEIESLNENAQNIYLPQMLEKYNSWNNQIQSLIDNYYESLTLSDYVNQAANYCSQGKAELKAIRDDAIANNPREPYAVLDGTTLYFYYDDQKTARNGMSVGPFTVTWNDGGACTVTGREWENTIPSITTAVFDESFGNCTTVTSTAGWFCNDSNLVAIRGIEHLKTENVTDMRSMFYGCSKLTSLDVSNFNTANATNLRCMFDFCSSLTSLDVNKFKTANVTDMSRMFESCQSLMSLDVSNFNTANVTNMSGMFDQCNQLVSLDVSNFNTANVTDMSFMFTLCQRLTSLDVSNFNTANVTDMSRMFAYCSSLTSLDVSNFNTVNVTDMAYMFSHCYSLTSLNVSRFKTGNVTDMSRMFDGCEVLNTIYAGDGWSTVNVTEGAEMFSECTNLVGGAGTTYDANHIDHAYARIDGGPNSQTPGYFTAKSTASNLEIFSVDKTVTYVPNQSITPTPSITMTPGNDAEWLTDLAIGLTNTTTGESDDPLQFTASIYYPNSTETFSYLDAMRGTLNPRDGDLTTNAETGAIDNTGTQYIPGYNNVPRSGGFIAYEALQDGSLIIPIRVTSNKSLFVVEDDGHVKTDIQFKDADGNTLTLLPSPLCAVSSEYVMGFLSFNVEQGRKYYVFCNGSKPRFAGYVFSTERITIDSETMKDVLDLLLPLTPQDVEVFAIDATTELMPNEPLQATRSVTMTPGNDSAWGVRLLEDNKHALKFTASSYYPGSTSSYTFWGGARGTNPAKDGDLTEGGNSGDAYDYTIKNTPKSGAYVTFEVSQSGSLIIPMHVPTNKPLYVVDSNGKVKTDIQFVDTLGQAVPMLAEPLCVFSETVSTPGYLSFNVTQGEKYTIFITGGADLRYGGYVFSTESITIDPATTANVKSILEAEDDTHERTLWEGQQAIDWDAIWEDTDGSVSAQLKQCKVGTVLRLYVKRTADDYAQGCATVNWANISTGITVGENNPAPEIHEDTYVDFTLTEKSFELLEQGNLQVVGHGFDLLRITIGPEALGPEPYAVLSENNTVLTFFYDEKKAANNGMSVGPFTTTGNSEEVTCTVTGREWENAIPSITTVVFDESFANCTTLTSTAGWFCNDSNLVEIRGIEYLKTENVTDMGFMFWECQRLISLDVRGFKTDNVTAMNSMFAGCSSLTSLDVSGFKTDNVMAMNWMFAGCSSLTSLDVSGFKTDNVVDMNNMFRWCSSLTSLDVSSFNTANMQNMTCMFYNCSSLTSLDVSKFNTDKVTSMGDMFWGCSSLEMIDVSGFNTSNVYDFGGMFGYCSAIKTLDVSNFDTSSSTWMRRMFAGCSGLTSLDVSKFKTDSVTNMVGMFELCPGLTSLDLSHFNTESVTDMSEMLYGCSGLTSLDLSSFNTANVTDMSGMFYGCSGLTSLYVTGFNTDNVTTMWGMFTDCSSLTSLDVSRFETKNVTSMTRMFDGCSSLTTLDVSHFNTDSLTAIGGMFRNCASLTSIDVSRFNTSKVLYMWETFSGCTNLTSLDVSNFNTANVIEMIGMFYRCSSLTSLDVSSFNTANVTTMNYLFAGCTSLGSIQAGNAVIPDSVYAQIGNPNLLLYVNEASLAPSNVQNVVVNGAAENIVLTDAEGNNNFYCPQEFTARRISYTHNYQQATEIGVSRGWETIVLPFTVQTITHEKNGPLAPFGVDGGKPFWLRQLTENGLISAQHIEANMPYLISMPNNGRYPADYNQAGNVTFSATNVVVPMTEQREMSGNNRMLIPTTMRVAQSPSVYAINRNASYENNPEGSIFVADYREVRPFEAYVEHTNGARFFTLSDLAEGDVTDIQAIHDIASADVVKVYNLSGVLLKTGKRQEVMSQLPKGIYIVNSVKVVVK